MQGILSDTCASYVRYDENTHRRILEEKVSFAFSAPQIYFVQSHEEAYPFLSPWFYFSGIQPRRAALPLCVDGFYGL